MKEAVKSKFSYPLSLERSYAKQMTNHTSQFIKIIESYIPDMIKLIEAEKVHMDDDKSRIEVLIDRIEKSIASIQGFKGKASKLYDMVDRHSSRQFNEAMKNAIGRAFVPNYKLKDFEMLKRVWVDENLSYIKSIEHDTLERIRSVLNEKIIDTIETASLSSELSKSIQKIAHNTKSRAVLIATDQVGKLNGRLMQYRQQHAGIEEYKWSSSHDRRVRPAHRQHDGNVYSWDKPPADGHPGQAIRCRCVAIPVIDFDNFSVGVKSGNKSENNGTSDSKNGIIKVKKVTLQAEPNSITDYVTKNGGVTRSFYDGDGNISKQIDNHAHGNSKRHPFGVYGEHVHDCKIKNGKFVRGNPRELTEKERKENGDIL